MVSIRDPRLEERDNRKEKKRLEEAQQNPRIKSIRLSGARLAVKIARQAHSSSNTAELSRYSIAQSTISIAMTIVEEDYQRANRLVEMARSISNPKAAEPEKDA